MDGVREIILLLAFLVSPHVDAKILKFKWDNLVKFKLDGQTFASGRIEINGNEIGSVDKTLFNAWRQYERTYRGYSFYELLDAVYGKDWRSAHQITFTAKDGYRQTVKIEKMLKASKKKNGYIAFSETGKKGFTRFKRGKKIIDPESFYLVWSGFARAHQAKHGDDLKWPFQLRSIHILSERFVTDRNY